MKNFYIITNNIKDPEYQVTNVIKQLIESEGGSAIIGTEGDYQDGRNCILENDSNLESIDCILSLGGDGTLLRAAGDLHGYDIPFIGMNLGTLGYLTEIEKATLEEDIHKLVQGETLVEERMMLSGQVNHMENVALNDVVLTRSGEIGTIRFGIYVNGAYLHSYKADGAIISTPTGSTGYSMSAGGPIVEPTATVFILTPICSHSLLNSRSIVLSAEGVIDIVLEQGREGQIEEANVSFDGRDSIRIKTGEMVRITKADRTMKLLKLSSVSFLETLRKKMAGS